MFGEEGYCVADGVGRTELMQFYIEFAHPKRPLAGERGVRGANAHFIEVEGLGEWRQHVHVRCGVGAAAKEFGGQVRVLLHHECARGFGGDDLDIVGEYLIAEEVVAVSVGVEHISHRGGGRVPAELIKHLPCVPHVVKRIYDQ